MITDKPLELFMLEDIFNEFEVYHNNHHGNRIGLRFNIRDQLWGRNLPEGLEEKVIYQFYEELDSDNEGWIEPEIGINVTTDNNGYRLLCDVDLEGIYNRIQSHYDDIEFLESDGCTKEEMEELIEGIKECFEELVVCALQLKWFKDYVEGMKKYYDDYIVIYNKEEDNFDFVYKEELDWMKDEGWKLWQQKKEIE